jgi:hypothetical protein
MYLVVPCKQMINFIDTHGVTSPPFFPMSRWLSEICTGIVDGIGNSLGWTSPIWGAPRPRRRLRSRGRQRSSTIGMSRSRGHVHMRDGEEDKKLEKTVSNNFLSSAAVYNLYNLICIRLFTRPWQLIVRAQFYTFPIATPSTHHLRPCLL